MANELNKEPRIPLSTKDDLVDGRLVFTPARAKRHKRRYKKWKPINRFHKVPVELYKNIWFLRKERKLSYPQIAKRLKDGWSIDITARGVNKIMDRIEAAGGIYAANG